MNLSSFLKKVVNRIELISLRGSAQYETLFLLGSLPDIKRITIWFNDPEYMHLGDHFFYEPLVRFLMVSGFIVTVAPTPAMRPYFLSLGCTVVEAVDQVPCDLLITRTELMGHVRSAPVRLLLEQSDVRIKRPLCEDFIRKCALLLKVQIPEDFSFRPSLPHFDATPITALKLDESKRYMLFNNYYDSASYRVTATMEQKVINCAALYAQEGYEIVQLGSRKEKEQDKRKYNFVTHDLRGLIKPLDLFPLTSLNSVCGLVAFDTFPMHVALLYDKPCDILFRGRFTSKGRSMVLNCMIPPYPLALEEKNRLVRFL